MLIQEMSRQDCVSLLARTRLCRLGCANEGQPYITPVYCAHNGNYIYSFSRLGQKITWMRANPRVCVEADEVASPQKWATVFVSGHYEELSNTTPHDAARKRAYELLRRRSVWWEPGSLQKLRQESSSSLEVIYFRVSIDRLSGRRGIPDRTTSGIDSATQDGIIARLRRILRRSI